MGETRVKYFFVYLAAVSLAAVLTTIRDKLAAKNHRRRVPEKTLFLTAALGGSAAMLITMVAIRHKTKHKRFMIGLPVIIAIQTALGIIFYS